MNDIIHVAIIEDDRDIRNTLAYIINGTPGFVCTCKYPTCEAAIEDIPQQYLHVILMDINLPGKSGIEGVSILKSQFPHPLA